MSGTTLSVSVEHITTSRPDLVHVQHSGGIYSVRIADVNDHEPYLTVWLVGPLGDLARSLDRLSTAIASLAPIVEASK